MNFFVLVLLTVYQLCEAVVIYPDYADHPCKRICVKGKTMLCYYQLHFEEMYSMESDCLLCLNGTANDCNNPNCIPADGNSRMINVLNRKLPAPTIQVCEGDMVIVDVENKMHDRTFTIHWHGMHQKDTQYMDGVPMITQCPILPFTTFRYRFKASPPGTHLYHSHAGVQRANGAYGSLIVCKPPQSDIHNKLYDFGLTEYIISLVDWFKIPPDMALAKLNRMKTLTPTDLSSIVVAGRGCQGNNSVPPIIYRVKQGKRYRFRVIHVGATVCPIEIRVHGHKLLIIALDGFDVEPFIVDVFTLTNGERVDFIINANQNIDTYWIKFKGSFFCAALEGSAILMYDNSPNIGLPTTVNTPSPNDMKGNCINVARGQPNCINYCDIKSPVKTEEKFRGKPDIKYFVGLSMLRAPKPDFDGVGANTILTPLLNNISFHTPTTALIFDPIDQPYCNNEDRRYCNSSNPLCICMHTLRIPLGSLVELILVDIGINAFVAHPMHLHGYHYRVVGCDRVGENTTVDAVKELDKQGKIIRNLINPPFKDTTPVPDGGYLVLRFIADNPGPWFFHCHVDFHMDSGMKMVLWVGDEPIKTPCNFPTCGNFYDCIDNNKMCPKYRN